MWKAIIDYVSEVDVAGRLEIIYSIFVDDKVTYPSIQINTTKDEYERVILDKMASLKEVKDAVAEIKIGDEIILK